ncbi:hypothetical protein JTB14_019665 [Gonioctena quinquepunctata]|nr:hypothetical protein JTB14_019665 [Gonioctena quinquepunctata]
MLKTGKLTLIIHLASAGVKVEHPSNFRVHLQTTEHEVIERRRVPSTSRRYRNALVDPTPASAGYQLVDSFASRESAVGYTEGGDYLGHRDGLGGKY